MIINSTNILRDSDYLDNTENVAMVHVHRVVEAVEKEFTIYTPFIVKVEGAYNGRNVIFPSLCPSGKLIQLLPVKMSIVKNKITFTDNGVSFVNAADNKFFIFAFGV
jgi:hypothetical protein